MKLSILQWNIWTQEKIENVFNLINSLNPDIICLQELTINNPSNNFIDTFQYILTNSNYCGYYHSAHNWPTEIGIKEQGNGIFTKFPIVDSNYFFTQTAGNDNDNYSNEGRVYVEIVIQVNSSQLKVGTTHLSYSHRFKETCEKIQETDALFDHIKNNKQHYLLCGDLNADENSRIVKKLSKKFHHAGPSYHEKTWTTKPFKYNGFEENKLHWRLDYVFATEDVKILNSKIIQTEYSDHLPILADFNI